MLASIEVRGGNAARTLPCHALAMESKSDVLYVLSVAGPSNTVNVMAAGLQAPSIAVEFRPNIPDRLIYRAQRYGGKYTCYKHRLGINSWHLLAIAQADGLLPAMNEEALWRQLSGPRFTTPILRSWVPWLKERMIAEEALIPLTSFGCHAGLLTLDSDGLDALVECGLSGRHLRIE